MGVNLMMDFEYVILRGLRDWVVSGGGIRVGEGCAWHIYTASQEDFLRPTEEYLMTRVWDSQ